MRFQFGACWRKCLPTRPKNHETWFQKQHNLHSKTSIHILSIRLLRRSRPPGVSYFTTIPTFATPCCNLNVKKQKNTRGKLQKLLPLPKTRPNINIHYVRQHPRPYQTRFIRICILKIRECAHVVIIYYFPCHIIEVTFQENWNRSASGQNWFQPRMANTTRNFVAHSQPTKLELISCTLAVCNRCHWSWQWLWAPQVNCPIDFNLGVRSENQILHYPDSNLNHWQMELLVVLKLSLVDR